jgi:Spy/CpxP family protein refolding chaperone
VKRYLLSSLLALLVCGMPCHGETPGDDPIAQILFPPELIMRYHSEIGLDDAQSKAIKDAIQKAQSRFTDLQWEMQSQVEKLAQSLRANPVDEAAALAQLERVLNLEREVKKTQISLLIRIKNVLTEAQQNKLTELRRKAS